VTQILDVIRERRPPFSPEAVVEEFAALAQRCARIKTYALHTSGERM
jgi:hypothetical protein